jgi:cell shape-determining protein MreC
MPLKANVNMSDIQKVPVPSVEKIAKYPWASITYFLFGIIAVLIVVMINQNPAKDCEEREKVLQDKLDKANQQTVSILQEANKWYREKEEYRQENEQLRDTVDKVKTKSNEALKLVNKALVR